MPDPFPGFTDLMLPLLSVPDVKITVETFIPRWRAVTRAFIVVELLRDTPPYPSSLRRLYGPAMTARCRRVDKERRVIDRPEGEPRPRVELIPDLARKVRRCHVLL